MSGDQAERCPPLKGITPIQREIFSLLYSNGAHGLRSISRRLHRDRRTVARNVYRLEKMNLVESQLSGCNRTCWAAPWVWL